jgi:hypothetical protein
MAASEQFWIYFTLVGDFEVASVTRELGLVPTEGWTSSRNDERKMSRWSLESRLNETTSVSEHIQDVINQLASCSDKVLALRRRFNGWIQVVGHFYSDSSSFHVDAGVLAQCSALQLGIDVDFVYFNEVKRESVQ